MPKSIVIEQYQYPWQRPAYGDKIAVFTNTAGLLYHENCSAAPNPFRPSTPWKKWYQCYGWIGAGSYEYEVVNWSKWGKAILINDGGPVASRIPNVNHYGKKILTEIFIHPGWSRWWRGSAGCITIPKHSQKWQLFIDCFDVGERGTVGILSPKIGK
jgi:hypothetical protein